MARAGESRIRPRWLRCREADPRLGDARRGVRCSSGGFLAPARTPDREDPSIHAHAWMLLSCPGGSSRSSVRADAEFLSAPVRRHHEQGRERTSARSVSVSVSVREIRQSGPYQYVFGRYAEPVARVRPGETVAIYTEDAFESRITRADDRPSEILGSYLNPQTGPIYVEGAEPGDTLAVRIEAIEPTRDWAVSAFIPHFGGLTSTKFTRTLQE